jgi:hypothetical protein
MKDLTLIGFVGADFLSISVEGVAAISSKTGLY